MIRVNPHIAVVSILTLPMILHLTCKIRMREITGCANTGTKTVNVKVYSLIMGTGASSLAHTELHSASPSGGKGMTSSYWVGGGGGGGGGAGGGLLHRT